MSISSQKRIQVQLYTLKARFNQVKHTIFYGWTLKKWSKIFYLATWNTILQLKISQKGYWRDNNEFQSLSWELCNVSVIIQSIFLNRSGGYLKTIVIHHQPTAVLCRIGSVEIERPIVSNCTLFSSILGFSHSAQVIQLRTKSLLSLTLILRIKELLIIVKYSKCLQSQSVFKSALIFKSA